MTKKQKKKEQQQLPEEYDGSVPLVDNKEELFVQACIESFGNKTKAYKATFGDESSHVRTMASRYFVANVNIKVRYDYLVQEGLKSAALSVEERLNEIREQMYVAMEEGNHNAYKGYHELIMKLQGEGVQKVDITSNGKEVNNGTNVTVDSDAINKALDKFKEEF